MFTLIDLILLAVLGGVTWMVSNDGAWSAGCTFVCTILAGLLAMNFFEPLSILLTGAMQEWAYRWDMVALVGLFVGFVFLFRVLSERIVPTYIQVPAMVDQGGRWAFALATGYVTMAFLLTAVHTAPLPREFLGFRPERPNFFGVAPDRQWLGFTQYVTEKSFARFDRNIGIGASNKPLPHAFDAEYIPIPLGDGSTYANTIFPSFPIRYAMRRGGAPVAAAPAAVQPPRPAPVQPTPGGGGPAGGGSAPGF
jgi:hypothetical protein